MMPYLVRLEKLDSQKVHKVKLLNDKEVRCEFLVRLWGRRRRKESDERLISILPDDQLGESSAHIDLAHTKPNNVLGFVL